MSKRSLSNGPNVKRLTASIFSKPGPISGCLLSLTVYAYEWRSNCEEHEACPLVGVEMSLTATCILPAGAAAAPMPPSPSVHLFVSLPAISMGIAAALLFQFGYGGLTITSFFLKLFIYISFALFCFLLGSFGLLVKKGPPKISRFETSKRQSTYLLDLFNKLMVSILNSFYSC